MATPMTRTAFVEHDHPPAIPPAVHRGLPQPVSDRGDLPGGSLVQQRQAHRLAVRVGLAVVDMDGALARTRW